MTLCSLALSGSGEEAVIAFKYAVALTGGIATGKSTVANLLREKGFVVIDADKIAHQVLDPQCAKIIEMFGEAFVVNGKVDRKALGSVVFADMQKRKMLESLLHPLIYEEIERQSAAEDGKQKLYFVDIPLFFETARYPIARSLLVYATKEQQLNRLMQRDGYNMENAMQRIDAQMRIEEKRHKATYVLDNSGDLTKLEAACDRIIEEVIHDGNKIFW